MRISELAMWSACLWAAVAAAAGAPGAPDPVARLALTEYLGTTDEAMIRELVMRTRQDIEAGARRAPLERRMASVFLVRGGTGAEIGGLLEPLDLALARMASMQPSPNAPGQFVPVLFDSRILNKSRERVGQRVDVALYIWREQEIRGRSRAIWDPSSGGAPPTEKQLRESLPHLVVYEL